MAQFKVVICGDGAIGKTCLLDTLNGMAEIDWDNPKYMPTAAANTNITEDVQGVGECEIEVWDTAGQEALESLRTVAYPGTQILLIGFNTCDKITLDNVEATWINEFETYCTDCEVKFLVGTKFDLFKQRYDDGDTEDLCDASEIIRIANAIGACEIILTSAKTGEGIVEEAPPSAEGVRPDPSYFNLPSDDEGAVLKLKIPEYCAKIYQNEEIVTVEDCGESNTWAALFGGGEPAPAAKAAPAPAPAAPAPAPAAPAPAPAAPAPAPGPAPAPAPGPAPAPAPAPGPAPAPPPSKDNNKPEKDNNSCCTVL